MHNRLKGYWRWATGDTSGKEVAQDGDGGVKVCLNAGERIDWVLQDPMNIAGSTGELLNALPSHGSYMQSKDVAAFIQARSDAISQELMAADFALPQDVAQDAALPQTQLFSPPERCAGNGPESKAAI